ncbi:Type I restriction modification DNA specificity domain protein [Mycobacterium marinum]|uniref:restriction endonuclease subunit S n=1 Tax=Mycobacterium marinum TaxID=1781 RepID=UPI000E3B650B|nr:restriction endonuclease subunit S [Mycobacterium marinum]RFZ54018.1 Type I restriction modification DNA specificity domain protein [Mycobacterium marinum]
MTCWQEMPLGEFITLQRGFDLTEREATPGQYPVFSSGGQSYTTDVPKVEGPGVITGRKGVLGKVHYSAGPFWPHDTTLWVKDFKGSVPRFVHYLLQTLPLASLDAGAANPTLNRNHAHLLPVTVPDALAQERIAGVLGGIDDLIENSQQRVAVLRQMARAIYREWFVHFRFPGHDGLQVVESGIPDGWQIRTLGEMSHNFDRRRQPLSKVQRDKRRGEIPYYGAAKLIDRIDGWIFEGEYLLFAEDGSVATVDGHPVLQLVEGKFWANNHTHILQGDGVSTRFLYLACEQLPVRPYVTGAAQPKITQGNLNRMPVLVGPDEIQSAFEEVISPLFDELRCLKKQAESLTAIRDLLLPHLVSGRVDLSGLDLQALMGGAVA